MEELYNKILNSISKGNTAIFCGAGISYHSGLPLANELCNEILTHLNLCEKESSLILNSNIPFEFFIETIRNEVNVDHILDIFSKGKPNTNHELIAKLVKGGFIKTILTTNFDVLIEQALIKIGLEEGLDFEVFSSEEEFGKLNWNSSTVKLIKLHGCISDKSEMAITLSAVASKTVCVNKNNIIKNFFSSKINPKVIVIGYSCSDFFDISPQIELINKGNSEIFFIEHISDGSGVTVEDITLKNDRNPFKLFTGKRINIHADRFVQVLWEKFVGRQYQLQSSSISWIENIDIWLNQAIETNSIAVKNHLSSRLFYNIGEYEYSIKQSEQGIIIAQCDKNQIAFYSELGNLGMTFNALGSYKEARRCLEESVKACHDIGNMQGEISQLQALGNIYRNIGDFDLAIKVLKSAVSLAEEQDIESLCTSLGNLATVYTQAEQPQEAIQYLEKGLEIAYRIGNKQSEGSILCSIGISYSQLGNYQKAIQLIQESINTARLLGDRQLECIALLNLSNAYLQIKDFDKCLVNAISALQIAKVIHIRQSEGGANYSIGNAYFFKGDAESAIPYLKKAVEIYAEIYGDGHKHTHAAVRSLFRAEKFPQNHILQDTNFI